MNMPTESLKRRLIQIVLQRSFQYRDAPTFKLASGRRSQFYFNCKTTVLHPEGMYLVGTLGFRLMRNLDIQAVGGLTLGADPVACAISYTSFQEHQPIEAFIVRKEPKKHGTRLPIEGNIADGDRVVVVDDVITTGRSTLKAIGAARDNGLEVVQAVALIDRQEGGRENIEAVGVPFQAILIREEIMRAFREGEEPGL
jgi:orotate phosphoribosyltransferase